MVGEDININMIFRVLVSPLSSALHTLLALSSPRTMSNSWHHTHQWLFCMGHGGVKSIVMVSPSLPQNNRGIIKIDRCCPAGFHHPKEFTVPYPRDTNNESGSYGNSKKFVKIYISLAFLFILHLHFSYFWFLLKYIQQVFSSKINSFLF